VNIKPAYFDLIGHLKYSDIDEQSRPMRLRTHTHTPCPLCLTCSLLGVAADWRVKRAESDSNKKFDDFSLGYF